MCIMLGSLVHGLALAFQGLTDATAENGQALQGRLSEWAPHGGLRLELVSEGHPFVNWGKSFEEAMAKTPLGG